MNFYWLWSYLVALWGVAVTCAAPVNWNNCWPPHEWLLPYVQDYMDARQPYATEKKILQQRAKVAETQDSL